MLKLFALIICVTLSYTPSRCDAEQQFYCDGKAIGAWNRYPAYGLDETYHFAKFQKETFWRQQLAVRYYKHPDRIYFYDHLVSRTFKGYYDTTEDKYFTLPDQYRRHRISEIRNGWFREVDGMPYLYNMFKNRCQPQLNRNSRGAAMAGELAPPPALPALPKN